MLPLLLLHQAFVDQSFVDQGFVGHGFSRDIKEHCSGVLTPEASAAKADAP